jgi:hypothetical protein
MVHTVPHLSLGLPVRLFPYGLLLSALGRYRNSTFQYKILKSINSIHFRLK